MGVRGGGGRGEGSRGDVGYTRLHTDRGEDGCTLYKYYNIGN